MFQITENKLSASDAARKIIGKVTDDIRTCKSSCVGDVTNGVFVSVADGQRQAGTALFINPTTNSANYTINNGISVLRATFGIDSRTIILSTTPIPANITNTLTVNNVRDRASAPNTILLNTQRTFSLVTARPIDSAYLSLPKEQLGPSSRRHGVVTPGDAARLPS